MRLISLVSVLFLCVPSVCFADQMKEIHPYDRLLLDLSDGLKSGVLGDRIEVSDTVMGCAGFFDAMRITIEGTEFSSDDVIRGLDKMSDDMSNLSFVLLTGFTDDLKSELGKSRKLARDNELVVLNANGLRSVGFVHRYKECQQVYYFTNYVLMNGKRAVSEALSELEK